MSAVVMANILLAIPFLVTFIVVPLWWTFKRPQSGADHAEAHAYLRTRTAFADALAHRQSARARTAAAARTHAA
jgi:hypothetical protein